MYSISLKKKKAAGFLQLKHIIHSLKVGILSVMGKYFSVFPPNLPAP